MVSLRPNLATKIRLQRYLATCGVGSRRACEELIRSGRVTVNGQLVTVMGFTVDPDQTVVSVDGKSVVPEARLVLALNKPKGIVCTSHDPQGRRTVLSLLPDISERIYTIGRLDQNSEGLILITNDGMLAQAVTHPSRHVRKVYHVWVDKPISGSKLDRMKRGLTVDGEKMRMLDIASLRRTSRHTLYKVTLGEGKKRQIRRMFLAVGEQVRRLKRQSVGSIELGDLEPGQYRKLTANEIRGLYVDADI